MKKTSLESRIKELESLLKQQELIIQSKNEEINQLSKDNTNLKDQNLKVQNENEQIKLENKKISDNYQNILIELRKTNEKYNKLLVKYDSLSSKSKIIKALPYISKTEKTKVIIDDAEEIIKEEKNKKRSRKGEKHGKKFSSFDFEKNVAEIKILKPEETVCPKCGETLVKFSEDISYLVKTKMPEIIVTKLIKENYKCPKCNKKDNKIFYPISSDPFPGSILTSSLASFIAFNKYELGIPFEHLSNYISTQINIPISKQCLANYMARLAERLEPIYIKMREDLINNEAGVIHADETTLAINRRPQADINRKKSYIYLYSSSFYGSQINIYDFRVSREAENVINMLQNFKGVIVVDDCAIYDKACKKLDGIILQRCWAHARRKFANIVKTIDKKNLEKSIAAKILKQIEKLFETDKKIKEKSVTLDDIKKLRKKEEIPILAKIYKLVFMTKVKLGSPLEEAINYFKSIKLDLLTYLQHPTVDLTNNMAERAIKPFVIQRKAFMTSRSYEGAQIMAILFSIIRTAKINMLDIYDYIEYLSENIGKEKIENLVPYSEKMRDKFNIL